jgi:hypothetical protein
MGYLRVLILVVRIKMNGSHSTESAGVVAPWPSIAAAPNPARSGFSGHDARLSMGISSKQSGARGGSHLGQWSSWETAVVVHDGGATPSGLVYDGG